VFALAAGAPAASAAEPASFHSFTDSCLGSSLPAPVKGDHMDVITRLTSNAGGDWGTGATYDGFFAAGDVSWLPDAPVMDGQSPGRDVFCDEGGTYTLTYYDTPSTPTSFAGRTSDPDFGSVLRFFAPGEAEYEVSVLLAGGPLELFTFEDGGRLAESGTMPIGRLERGYTELDVYLTSGVPSSWVVGIYALPVEISRAKFTPAVVNRAAKSVLSYRLEGDTVVSVDIVDRNGNPVRRIASAVDSSSGEHTTFWNGRTSAGRRARDGAYTALITTVDPSGQRSTRRAELTLDTKPPNTRIVSLARASHRPRVSLRLRASERVRQFQCRLDRGRWTRCRRRAVIARLDPGAHTIQVRAVDIAGNVESSPASRRFRVA
jgi:hypothetical protein